MFVSQLILERVTSDDLHSISKASNAVLFMVFLYEAVKLHCLSQRIYLETHCQARFFFSESQTLYGVNKENLAILKQNLLASQDMYIQNVINDHIARNHNFHWDFYLSKK